MAATSAVLLSGLKAGDHLVMSDVNYAGTAELARVTLRDYGIETSVVDTSDLPAVEAALRPETRMLWIETPANPILRLTDIAAIAGITRELAAFRWSWIRPSQPPSPRSRWNSARTWSCTR